MKLYKPKRQSNKFDHIGDTFRELIDLWAEHGYVEIEEHNGKYCWLNAINDILLYDRPTYEWLGVFNKYNIGLFGNNPPISKENNLKNTDFPWTFWGRHPRQLEQMIPKILQERTISSVFVGKIENNVQAKYRTNTNWKDCIEVFEMPTGGSYKYTQKEYLELISKSKYGLCLRGYGPKCNREIELFALGVVPLATPEVDFTYYDPPIENVHYFRVRSPEDVNKIIKETPDSVWESMSKACRHWYEKNASVKGSFDTTMSIVNKGKNIRELYKKPCSINTLATDNSIKDLRLLLKSVRKFDSKIPIFLVCDSMILNNVSTEFSDLNIKYKNVLDVYSGKNRKEMEKEGIWNDFMKTKLTAIRFALDNVKDTIHVDSDILFLDSIPIVNTSKDIGLCPHRVKQFNIDNYGKYNAGMIYVNTKEFVDWWEKEIPTSKFYDQGCLEHAPMHFSEFEFDITVDFGWWTLFECDNSQERLRKLNVDSLNDCVTYGLQRLNSVHTHFEGSTFGYTVNFSKVIKNLINNCQHTYKNIFDDVTSDECVVVFSQYYNDKNNERQKEIDFCLQQNVNCKHTKKYVQFNEPSTKLPINSSKIKKVSVNDRLTFKVAMEHANKPEFNSELVCIANGDIFLDPNTDWKNMKKFLLDNPGYIFALSRHEFDGKTVYKDPVLQRLAYANSQDAWFYISPIQIPDDIDFVIGTLGCDNAIADRFRKSNYIPINSPNEYKIIHYDVCRKKDGKNFLEFSKNYENDKKVKNDHPEKRGQRLCPDIDCMSSFDEMIKQMKLDKYQKYEIFCDIFSKYVKINNKY